MAFAKGDRVRKGLTGEPGTVDGRPVPGYAWVHWDNGSFYPVSEDSLLLAEPGLARQCRELIAHWRKAQAQLTAAGYDEGYGSGLADAAQALEDLVNRLAE